MKPGELLRAAGPCLDAAKMEAFVEGRLPEVSSHIEACPACAHEVASFREFLAAEAGAEQAADLNWIEHRLTPPWRAARRGWFQWPAQAPVPRWAMSLAALLLVVAGGLQVRRLAGPGTAGEPANMVRSAQLQITAPAGDVGVAPTQFHWENKGKAGAYVVELSEIDGALVWSGRSNQPNLSLPPDIQRAILPRKTLVWRVRALGTDGSVIAESAPARFRLMPPE
ncbi:MAG: hypothetical protein HY858_01710 [Candidatus Solibacter usitatus]|nr:hypothetical protein [Candidatus Solibacter usitatus]